MGVGRAFIPDKTRRNRRPVSHRKFFVPDAFAPFELVLTCSGATSIRNVELNQTMHGSVGPWGEANALYVEPSRLKALLAAPGDADVTLFDVGLGAAANALAAIRVALDTGATLNRRLRVISFERDIRLLGFAVEKFENFPHFERFREALLALLNQHLWLSPCGRIRWELRVGDFLKLIDQELLTPDIIFHDPYSPAANPEMWDIACFEKLRRAASKNDGPTSLHTYSCATPVRAALLLSGFFVGLGPATGRMNSTTIASTRLDALSEPLDERWMSRWLRSHTRYPYGTTSDSFDAMTATLRRHPQFPAFEHE